MDWLCSGENCHVSVIPASPDELPTSVGSEKHAQPLLGETDLGGAGLSKPTTLWPEGFPPNPAGPACVHSGWWGSGEEKGGGLPQVLQEVGGKESGCPGGHGWGTSKRQVRCL